MDEKKLIGTRGEFKKAFDGQYVSDKLQSMKRFEFLSLEQGDKSVIEYEQMFINFLYFSSRIQLFKEAKASVFQVHLNQGSRVWLWF